jgi:hypothetical protein
MNNNWLKYLVATAAIMIAGSAAYFSVTGLGVLFSGASVAVMVMATSLEFAKLVAATYLKQKWDDISGFNKWYLTGAVGILMLITSAGIFGYLSNAFQKQNLGLQKVDRDIAVYQTQITKNDGEITRYTTQLNNQQNIRNSQESNLSKQIDKDKSTSRVSQMIKSADKEIRSISNRIDLLTIKNNAALDSINVIKNNNIELEKEVGGFRFVAEAFNVELKSVVKFFIILIVIVFDPLAVALIISFNQLVMGNKRKEDEFEPITEPSTNPEDLKEFVDETARIKLSQEDLNKLESILLNPPKPNENLKMAADEYKRRGELLQEIIRNDEELGLYNEPFENPMVKEEDKKWDGISQEVWDRMEVIEKQRELIHGPITEEDLPPTGAYANSGIRERLEQEIDEEPYAGPIKENVIEEDDISDWDVTLMDGLEDEEPFFTEEETENIFQEEPTEEEIQGNFSNIEPNTENIFQDNNEFVIPVDESIDNEPELMFSDEFLTQAIEEFNQESLEEEDEPIYQSETKEIDQMLDIVNNEDVKESETSPDKDDEKKKLEYQTETLELEILPTLIEEITTPTLESQDSKEEPENLYWEVDDVNPNQVIYDIENNKVITPTSEEEITVISEPVRKVISRNVSSRRRNFR